MPLYESKVIQLYISNKNLKKIEVFQNETVSPDTLVRPVALVGREVLKPLSRPAVGFRNCATTRSVMLRQDWKELI